MNDNELITVTYINDNVVDQFIDTHIASCDACTTIQYSTIPTQYTDTDLPDVLIGHGDDVVQRRRLNLNAFLEANGHDGAFDLVDARFIEAQIEGVVGQRADFLRLPVVAHGDDRNLGLFDELDEFVHPAAIFVTGHAVHFVHY